MKTIMQELVDIMNQDQVSFTEWFQDNYQILIEKEKEQIIEAYEDGKQNGMDSITNIHMYIIGEKYYNQTYNQDRELPKDVKDMLNNL
jgi:hypothetical protein